MVTPAAIVARRILRLLNIVSLPQRWCFLFEGRKRSTSCATAQLRDLAACFLREVFIYFPPSPN
jgi:hypothetical protein